MLQRQNNVARLLIIKLAKAMKMISILFFLFLYQGVVTTRDEEELRVSPTKESEMFAIDCEMVSESFFIESDLLRFLLAVDVMKT